jgi:putative salt-induced outer membrane protein YdiY
LEEVSVAPKRVPSVKGLSSDWKQIEPLERWGETWSSWRATLNLPVKDGKSRHVYEVIDQLRYIMMGRRTLMSQRRRLTSISARNHEYTPEEKDEKVRLAYAGAASD